MVIGEGPWDSESPCHQLGGLGEANVNSPSKFPQWGPGWSPGKFGFLSILDLNNNARMVCQIMLFLIQSPCVVKGGAESADTSNKLNSMDSVLVDIENVVIMSFSPLLFGLFKTRPT